MLPGPSGSVQRCPLCHQDVTRRPPDTRNLGHSDRVARREIPAKRSKKRRGRDSNPRGPARGGRGCGGSDGQGGGRFGSADLSSRLEWPIAWLEVPPSVSHRPLQLLVHQMGVDHGGPQMRVPQGFLGQANVAGIPEEVSGKGVAQYVRGHTFGVVPSRYLITYRSLPGREIAIDRYR